VTLAALYDKGTVPAANDRVNSYAMNGKSSSAQDLNNQVGKISLEHCLSGNLMIAVVFSATVTMPSDDS
jgi:hypothetical protein